MNNTAHDSDISQMKFVLKLFREPEEGHAGVWLPYRLKESNLCSPNKPQTLNSKEDVSKEDTI